jgi:23S rRNA-/tRNA-specific pseudouridylate synthase
MMFDAREIHKTYQAVIHGTPEWDNITCAEPLLVNADRSHRTRVSPQGKPAQTDFQVLERYAGKAALMQAKPRTGLTHQIRAHLSYLGHPIIHDTLYGSREDQARSPLAFDISSTKRRMALHAAEISFTHPVTRAGVSITSPLPADMNELITYLRDSE